MRPRFLPLALLAWIAAPAGAQTCPKAPLPSLPELFPDTVQGMERQFYNRMDQCYTNIYRPSAEAVKAGALWAVVSIEPSPTPSLGESAEGLVAHYAGSEGGTVTVGGWPVAVHASQAGHEFTSLRGGVRINVVVKGGDGGPHTKELAVALYERILPLVPCG
jgi:cold shock CspA family protein